MKKMIYFLLFIGFVGTSVFSISSCKTSAAVKEKTGAVLWSENCSRCHYSPDPEDYNDAQWEVIYKVKGYFSHMKNIPLFVSIWQIYYL